MSAALPLDSFLCSRLLGQEEAIRQFSSAIERAESGPERHGRTRAFVLLMGPTGTGKTEMVKLTAGHLYGHDSSRCLERFDMGEYQHRDSVLRLLGAPGQPALLGAAVDRLNALVGGMLLLDEIEKAHPDLLTALLSFDDARTTMADGSTRDLSRCYVVMTSNLGAAEAAQMSHNGYSAIRRKVIREAESFLRKETVARFSAVVVMNTLSFEVQERIAVALFERELRVQSEHCRRVIEVADARVLNFLVGKGFSPDLGARNLRHVIERYVGDALRPFFPKGRSPSPSFPEKPSDRIGDRWSHGVVLAVVDDALVARPLQRSVALDRLLSVTGSRFP